jgi:hypothetical protein
MVLAAKPVDRLSLRVIVTEAGVLAVEIMNNSDAAISLDQRYLRARYSVRLWTFANGELSEVPRTIGNPLAPAQPSDYITILPNERRNLKCGHFLEAFRSARLRENGYWATFEYVDPAERYRRDLRASAYMKIIQDGEMPGFGFRYIEPGAE